MSNLIQRSCGMLTIALLALPAASLAAPVTVVTHSTGIASINPSVLYGLGQEETPAEYELPYELTLSSTFDWSGPLPGRDGGPSNEYADIVVDFRVGDLDYHYAGTGYSSAGLYTPPLIGGDTYRHTASIFPNPNAYGYSFDFENVFRGPAGSMGPGGPLTPGAITGSRVDGYDGYLTVTAFYSNDEYTFMFPMSGDVATYSVVVTSPVPEPAPFAMLAAGVFALGLRRRRQ